MKYIFFILLFFSLTANAQKDSTAHVQKDSTVVLSKWHTEQIALLDVQIQKLQEQKYILVTSGVAAKVDMHRVDLQSLMILNDKINFKFKP